MEEELHIETDEMHTGGEPVRIVRSTLPGIQGSTILEKIRYIRENMDYVRKLLIYEPRGHYDMYGVIFVTPDVPDAQVGCVFIHNEGYSSMCGHAVISLGRYVIDKGLVSPVTSPETRVLMQCPCGPVEVFVQYENGKTGNVRFQSVPSYIFQKDVTVSVPDYGQITLDVVYGGAFYGIVPISRFGLEMTTASVDQLRTLARIVKDLLARSVALTHPESADLALLYGIIFTDDNDARPDLETSTCCVFAASEVDRSPCGSGTSARIAQQFARGYISLDQERVFRGPTGARFRAKAVRQVKFGPHDAVVTEVSGRGYYSGSCTFTLEKGDEIGRGFLLD